MLIFSHHGCIEWAFCSKEYTFLDNVVNSRFVK